MGAESQGRDAARPTQKQKKSDAEMRRSLVQCEGLERALEAGGLHLPLPVEQESRAVDQGPHEVFASRFRIACTSKVLNSLR